MGGKGPFVSLNSSVMESPLREWGWLILGSHFRKTGCLRYATNTFAKAAPLESKEKNFES